MIIPMVLPRAIGIFLVVLPFILLIFLSTLILFFTFF